MPSSNLLLGAANTSAERWLWQVAAMEMKSSSMVTQSSGTCSPRGDRSGVGTRPGGVDAVAVLVVDVDCWSDMWPLVLPTGTSLFPLLCCISVVSPRTSGLLSMLSSPWPFSKGGAASASQGRTCSNSWGDLNDTPCSVATSSVVLPLANGTDALLPK